ncbi:MAG: hypothetical protein J2P44_10970 [Candidatus Dormibacteraeota bacterium]|nr:hypothetical protein [Candidatus Dormibacteraeota bacterium]
MPLEGAAPGPQSQGMHVPLQPGAELVCNCRAAHRATVSGDGAAPPLPATCTGSFWSRPLGPGGPGRIYGALVSAGVIVPSGTRCAYLP